MGYKNILKGGTMYKKVLVPVDGSELAECVLPHVKSIATGCSVPDVIFVRVARTRFSTTERQTKAVLRLVRKNIEPGRQRIKPRLWII